MFRKPALNSIFSVLISARPVAILLLTALTLIFCPERSVHAATLVVDTENDELDDSPGNGACSLREAIDNANNDNGAQADCTAGAGSDAITLPSGVYTLTGASGEDNNASGDLDITGVLTINGVSAEGTRIQAGSSSPVSGACADCVDRVLHTMENSTVTLNNLTIRYGRAPDNSGSLTDHCGGGILDTGSLTLSNCIVGWNRSGNGDEGGNGGIGGGIYSFSLGVLQLTGVSVIYNRTGDGGNGDAAVDKDAGNGGSGGMGGGVSSGISIVIDSIIAGNTTGAGGDGGDVTSGNGNGGYAGAGGGAAGMRASSNTSGSLVVIDSTIRENLTGAGGSGGAGSGSGATGGDGDFGSTGGLYLRNVTASINGSTIQGNEAWYAGGIYIATATSDVTMTNSTISGNRADGNGGGIYAPNSSVLALTHVTITQNTADRDNNGGGDGGGIFGPISSVTLTNTIVAGNSDKGGEYPDCRCEPVSEDYNLLGICEGAYCVFTPQPHDVVGTTASPANPVLGLLVDNGGGALTHAIKSNGPAAGQIPGGVNGCSASEFDQRGVMRLPPCDMGAYETGKAWGGAVDSDWHTSDNWQPSGAPRADLPITIEASANDPDCYRDFADAAALVISGGCLSIQDYDLAIGGSP